MKLTSIQNLANAFNGIFSIKNSQRQYIFVSDNWLRILGLTREEVIGKTDHEILPVEKADQIRLTDLEALEKKIPMQYTDNAVLHGTQLSYMVMKWVVADETGESFCLCTLADFMQGKQNILAFQKDIDTILHSLCFTYAAENYCLRRIPRLISLVETQRLAQLLSDHVSVIMDRLNLLDDIFSHYKTRPSSFKGLTNPLGDNLRVSQVKEDHRDQKLINILIEVSRHRSSLYELLVSATSAETQSGISLKLLEVLKQEEKFLHDLITIKREIAFEGVA